MSLHLMTQLLLLLVSNVSFLIRLPLVLEVGWFLFLVILSTVNRPRSWRLQIIFGCLYLLTVGLTEWYVSSGRLAMFVMSFLFIIRKTLPMSYVGVNLWQSTTVDEWMQGLERLRLPMAMVIPLTVTFRLLPTMVDEFRSIRWAQKMRATHQSLVVRLEGLFVAFLMSGLTIGDELANAAIVRGLGRYDERTYATVYRLQWWDYLVMFLGIVYVVSAMVRGEWGA